MQREEVFRQIKLMPTFWSQTFDVAIHSYNNNFHGNPKGKSKKMSKIRHRFERVMALEPKWKSIENRYNNARGLFQSISIVKRATQTKVSRFPVSLAKVTFLSKIEEKLSVLETKVAELERKQQQMENRPTVVT